MIRLAHFITQSLTDLSLDYKMLGFWKLAFKLFKAGGWTIVVILILLVGIWAFRSKERKKIRKVIG